MNSLAAVPPIPPHIDKLLENSPIMKNQCHICGAKNKSVVYEVKPCPHFASIRCGKCDCFLGWLENPDNSKKRFQVKKLIGELLKLNCLSQWEYNFLSSLKSQKKHSPKQKERLQSIAYKYNLLA